MVNIFGMREPETPDQKRAYELGRQAAGALYAAVGGYLDQRLPEVANRLVDAFRQRLREVLERPEHPPALLVKIEFNVFQEHVAAFSERLNAEINQNLSEWLTVADGFDGRPALDQYIQGRLFTASFALWETSIHLVAAVLASLPEPPGPTPDSASSSPVRASVAHWAAHTGTRDI